MESILEHLYIDNVDAIEKVCLTDEEYSEQ